MKIKILACIAVAAMLLNGCASMDELLTPKTKTGAGIGAVAGGVLGAIVDSNKPWRGAIIGAAAGAAAGGWIGHTMEEKAASEATVSADKDIVDQAAREAVKSNAIVKYSRTTEEGVNEDIIARPGAKTGNVQPVTIEYYRNSKLVSTETRQMTVS
ncbi:MAG TPA: glycine zipper domain-containing protein [bacterium]|nr:glycine zipper domain-containing protein [bacterium]